MRTGNSSLATRRIPIAKQKDNTIKVFSTMIPKAKIPEISLDPEFIMNEINNRVEPLEEPQPGFVMPDQAHIPQDYWDSYAYTSKPQLNKSESPFITARDLLPEEKEEHKFTFIRMGDTTAHQIVRYARTPELPSKTRKPISNEKYPHYNEKAPKKMIRRAIHSENPVEEYVSWKYFGNTDNVCGCYTAKIPVKMRKCAEQKNISHLPNGMNKLKKIAKKPISAKERKCAPRDLFELSIARPTQKPNIREIITINDEKSEFDEYIDEGTESYIEYNGKMMPLKYSSLNKTKVSS